MTEKVFTPPYSGKNTYVSPTKQQLNLDKLLLLYGKRVVARINTSGTANATIYAVPKGELLFLLTAQVHVTADSGLGIGGNANIRIAPNNVIQSIVRVNAEDGESITECANFSIPLLLKENENLELASTITGTIAYAQITGYVIDAQTFYSLA